MTSGGRWVILMQSAISRLRCCMTTLSGNLMNLPLSECCHRKKKSCDVNQLFGIPSLRIKMSNQKPRHATEHDKEIGFRIRKIRQDKRLTQSEVAAELHITYQQLQKYELGKNKIPASRLSKIAKILGIPVQEILQPSKNFEQLRKIQDQHIVLLWGQLKDDKKRNIVLMLLESLTSASN